MLFLVFVVLFVVTRWKLYQNRKKREQLVSLLDYVDLFAMYGAVYLLCLYISLCVVICRMKNCHRMLKVRRTRRRKSHARAISMIISHNKSFHEVNLWKHLKMDPQISIKLEVASRDNTPYRNLLLSDIY